MNLNRPSPSVNGQSTRTGSALTEYLDPDLAVLLVQDGDLPAVVRATLADELRRALAACAAYIPARLVRTQLAQPQPGRVGGAFWKGSLLFADLSGFTALSESLSVLGKQGAEEVSAVVNQLFSALIAELSGHHGMLLKFGGDALTAFFDADLLGSAHAAAASSAALALQTRMNAFAAVETRAGTFQLGLRVGVHSGRVFAAEVGDTTHIELVVTGPDVNRVALAQEIAAPGEVVVSEQTAALLHEAALAPRHGGFYHLRALRTLDFADPPPLPLAAHGPDDIASLERLAAQVAALRPYLIYKLPRRFLDPAFTGLGEFRPVSVLFANFHDMSANLGALGNDAATAAMILNAYFRRAQAVVHRYDGIVNKVDMYTHGDKLMALFGAPLAHEDDPLRAVRCALELEHALAEANEEITTILGDWEPTRLEDREIHSVSLAQKIGINTGTVFAGRVGGAQRYEYTVMGPAVNLAARLMSAAADGTVLLSPATRSSVAHQIAVENQAPLMLKGLAAPVTPARALHAFEIERTPRAEAGPSLSSAPLIGRDEELAQLLAAATSALSGAGRVLALVGEAGAGKSRLTEELVQRLVMASVAPDVVAGVPCFTLHTGDCQSYEQRAPYAAVRAPLRSLLGSALGRSETVAAKQGAQPDGGAGIEPALAQRVERLAPDLARFTPLLGDVLGIELAETALTRALTPQQRHDRAQELVVALLRGAARREPLIFLIEDIHWADAASLELLARLAQAIAPPPDAEHGAVPLLMLVNYRPDPPIPEPWRNNPTTTRIVLHELGAERSADLLAALLGGPPPSAVVPLLERTQGNPFFIEELVRSLVASGAMARDAAGTWQLTRPLNQVALPNSIEGLLTARLDQLDEQHHELVQVAAVIGRRFQSALVEGVYSAPSRLEENLLHLMASEIVVAEDKARSGDTASPLVSYLFRHALLRDVAYEGILYARRREMHHQVAQRIETLYDNTAVAADEYLALLAWHYLHAEEWSPAFRYHRMAGTQAQQRYANRDALALFTTALEIAPRLAVSEDPTALIVQVAELHERSGDLHVLLGEYDQAEAAYNEALGLAQGLRSAPGDSLQQLIPALVVRLHRLLAIVYERRSDYDGAFGLLERGMAQATSVARVELARCYLLGAGIYYRRGEFARAMEWARMGHSFAERMEQQAEQAHALLLMGNLWQEQGEFGSSITALEQARASFEEINQVSSLSNALNNLGMSYLKAGRWKDTITCFERSLAISENIGDVQAIARTSNNLALVLVGRGELQRAAELYKYSGEQFARIGSTLGVAVTRYNRGEVLLLQDQPGDALPLFVESIATFERIKARNFLPEVLRLAAEATLTLGDMEQAHSYATRSLALADELGMAVEAAVARRVLGQIALSAADHHTAHAAIEESCATLEHLDNRYELGRSLFWQARVAQATANNESFSAALRRAEQIFVELDAQRDLALLRALEGEG